ncbi:MAG TPA: GNAT family N-acetyltransferase [Phycisphaerae bacterium]
MIQIVEGGSDEQIQTIRALFREYATGLQHDLCFQDFECELATLPGDYAPPRGRLFLATADELVGGCVALRPIEGDVCEMKRLYVRPAYRGGGVGRALATRVIDEARRIGYARMRLDTLPEMSEAVALYRSLGFREIPSYRYNPGVRSHIHGTESARLHVSSQVRRGSSKNGPNGWRERGAKAPRQYLVGKRSLI